MPATESFRVEVLGQGQRLPDSQLIKRLTRFTTSIQKVFSPLKLGGRLQFQTETEGTLLWLVASIEPSGQVGLYAEEPEGATNTDSEHQFELDTSRLVLRQAIGGLHELAQMGRLTAAALERFVRQHSFERDKIPGIELLNAAIRERKELHLSTADGSALFIDCKDLPKFHTSESFTAIDFRVESVGMRHAQIIISKNSRQLLSATKSEIRLCYPLDQPGHDIRAALFAALQKCCTQRWLVRTTRSLIGEFHSAYVHSLSEIA